MNVDSKSMTDPLGRKTATTYDALDRARTVAITNSDATIPQGRSGYSLDYDPEGNLLSIVEQIRTGAATSPRSYSRTYDARNRLATSTDAFSRTVRYGYDATNNVTSFTDAANRQTGYSYDAMNRLDVATLPGGRQVNHDWTADGLLSRVEYGNGMTRAYSYDNADQVTGIINTHSASENEEFAYGYDANSNRQSETRKRNGATTRSIAYQFDSLNRLTQANYGGGASVTYGYDKVGNRVSELGSEVGGGLVNRTFAYDDLNRMSSLTDTLDATKSVTSSYDLNGNLLKDTQANGAEKRYEYDALNQMTRAASFSGGSETTLGSYDYDFQGRRISKTVGTAMTQYVYSGIKVVNEFDSANQVMASYDFGADLLRSDFAGEGERLYFHDALGSTTSRATSAGATVASYEYDVWGKLISAVQPSANKVNYTGYRKDEETGLDYAQARYYDSSNGRFTSFDPITENSERMNQTQGMNFYGYVMGNPLKYVDPKGTDWWYSGDPNNNYKLFWYPQGEKPAPMLELTKVASHQTFGPVTKEGGIAQGYLGYGIQAKDPTNPKFDQAFDKVIEAPEIRASLNSPNGDGNAEWVIQIEASDFNDLMNYYWRQVAIGMVNGVQGLAVHIWNSAADPVGTAIKEGSGLARAAFDTALAVKDIVLHPIQAKEAIIDSALTLKAKGTMEAVATGQGEMLSQAAIFGGLGAGTAKVPTRITPDPVVGTKTPKMVAEGYGKRINTGEGVAAKNNCVFCTAGALAEPRMTSSEVSALTNISEGIVIPKYVPKVFSSVGVNPIPKTFTTIAEAEAYLNRLPSGTKFGITYKSSFSAGHAVYGRRMFFGVIYRDFQTWHTLPTIKLPPLTGKAIPTQIEIYVK
jgi:RHS repeat-associated protein